MAKLVPFILIWMCIYLAEIQGKMGARILPLDHHRTLREAANTEQSHPNNGDGGNNVDNSDGGAATSNDGRSGQQGNGFLGDGMNIIGGRQSGNGPSNGSPIHLTANGGGNSAKSPSAATTAEQGGTQRPPAHSPTINSKRYSPTYFPSSYSKEGSGKSVSKSKGKKSKSKGKKSKSKGKAKSKRKKGKNNDIQSEEHEDAKPIEESSVGSDETSETTQNGGTSSAGNDDKTPEHSPSRKKTIELTPFGIIFDLGNDVGTPSSDNYARAINITVSYLDTYMSLQYEHQGLQDFQTTATSTIYRDGAPQIDFTAAAKFKRVTFPTKKTLDNNIVSAFSGANLALYLSMLQNLPESNLFRTVTGARLINPANTQSTSSGLVGSVGTVGTAGIAGAIGASGLILFAIGFMIYGKRRRPTRGSRIPIRNDVYASKQMQVEQVTVMGETTCSSTTTSGISISEQEKIPFSFNLSEDESD